MTNKEYVWTDNPTVSGVSKCDTDILNECLMHLKYDNNKGDGMPLFYNFYSKEDMTTTGAYVNASLGSWLSGNIYPTAYAELMNKLGMGNVKANTDTYTDYDFVVNQDDMTFRLPIKNGQEIMFATGVKGNGISLGLTNGKTNYGVGVTSGTTTALDGYTGLYGTNVGTTNSGTLNTQNISMGITADSSKLGIELDTENITIPDGWNLYYKVANVITNQELLDVAYVIADLNTKLSRGNKEEIAAWNIPDYTTAVSVSDVNYTAPYDGWLVGDLYASNTTKCVAYVNGVRIGAEETSVLSIQIPMKAGDLFTSNATISSLNLSFCAMKGAN